MVYHQIFEFPQAILLSLYLKTRYSTVEPFSTETHLIWTPIYWVDSFVCPDTEKSHRKVLVYIFQEKVTYFL